MYVPIRERPRRRRGLRGPPGQRGGNILCRVASDCIKGYDVHVGPNISNDVERCKPKLIGAGHEPRITSVPSPQDGHVHVGGPVHSTATCDHRDQSDGIFDPSHRNLPGFESKLF